MFFLRTQVAINFFHQIPKNCHFGVKKKSLPTQMDGGIIIFQGVQTKFPHLEEFVA